MIQAMIACIFVFYVTLSFGLVNIGSVSTEIRVYENFLWRWFLVNQYFSKCYFQMDSCYFSLRLPNPPGDIHILASVARYKSMRTQSSSYIFYFPLTHQLQEKKRKHLLSFKFFRSSILSKLSQKTKIWAISQHFNHNLSLGSTLLQMGLRIFSSLKLYT